MMTSKVTSSGSLFSSNIVCLPWLVYCLPTYHEKRLEHVPYLTISPVFTKNIRWIILTGYVREHVMSRRDGFTYTME